MNSRKLLFRELSLTIGQQMITDTHCQQSECVKLVGVVFMGNMEYLVLNDKMRYQGSEVYKTFYLFFFEYLF